MVAVDLHRHRLRLLAAVAVLAAAVVVVKFHDGDHMSGYVHVTALDDPAKPYKRVYLCEATNTYVKIHAVRRDVGFGRAKFDITGSLCGSDGVALKDAAGEALIHVEAHGMSIQTDAGIRRPDAVALLRQLVDDGSAETIAYVRQRARALFEETPSQAEIETRILEDFARESLFMVAKVERASRVRETASTLGGVKP